MTMTSCQNPWLLHQLVMVGVYKQIVNLLKLSSKHLLKIFVTSFYLNSGGHGKSWYLVALTRDIVNQYPHKYWKLFHNFWTYNLRLLPSRLQPAIRGCPQEQTFPYTLWLKVMWRSQCYIQWKRPHMSKNAWCVVEDNNNMENLLNLNWIACNNSVQVIDALWPVISFWSTIIRASCHFQ